MADGDGSTDPDGLAVDGGRLRHVGRSFHRQRVFPLSAVGTHRVRSAGPTTVTERRREVHYTISGVMAPFRGVDQASAARSVSPDQVRESEIYQNSIYDCQQKFIDTGQLPANSTPRRVAGPVIIRSRRILQV